MIPTVIEISKKALQNNVAEIRKCLPKKTKFMAVVKANAYGHGLFEVVNSIKSKVDYFATYAFEDAILMRKKGVKQPILVLSRVFEDQVDLAIKHDLIVTVSTFDILQKVKKPLRCHICVDTGLGRDGFVFSDLEKVVKAAKNSQLKIEGLYAHLAAADDDAENSYTKKQIAELLLWKKAFAKVGLNLLTHHAASAGALMGWSHEEFAIARIGKALYGNWPSSDVQKACEKKLKLIPAMTWKTQIVELRNLSKGSKISYNCTHTLQRNSLVATLPIGYFDGISRVGSGKIIALVNGKRVKQLGRVTMNLIVLDVTDLKNVKIGDEVVMIGAQGKEFISATEVGTFSGTSCYEVTTRLSSSIKRVVV